MFLFVLYSNLATKFYWIEFFITAQGFWAKLAVCCVAIVKIALNRNFGFIMNISTNLSKKKFIGL